MAGVHVELTETYIADEAITERYVAVSIGAAAGSCKLPDGATAQKQILGIAQTTALVGQPVSVAKGGSSYLVASGVVARGGRISATTSAPKGRAVAATEPTIPANATTPTAAEVDAARNYGTNLRTLYEATFAVAETAAAAAGDIIIVTLGAKMGVE